MRIIISPAKQMLEDTDTLAPLGTPVFMEKTGELLQYLRQLSYEEAKKLWGCSDKIAQQNYERIRHMDLSRGGTPALLSYDGIAYKYMAPAVFEDSQLAYVQEHLRILSGFYGVLKPMDAVTPYCLEMQAKAGVSGSIQTRTYEAQDGSKRHAFEVVADEVEFLSPVGGSAQRGNSDAVGANVSDAGDQAATAQAATTVQAETYELPF